jgi:hypothetical protein
LRAAEGGYFFRPTDEDLSVGAPFHPTDEDLSVGAPLRKKPLERALSVYRNSENAIEPGVPFATFRVCCNWKVVSANTQGR